MSEIRLDKVTAAEAVSHALAEAFSCFSHRPWLFCPGLAMLRKALDIWSADYRTRNGMKFKKRAGERDNLYWRLKKIAGENKAYQETIAELMDKLRIDGNDVLHKTVRCPSYAGITLDASALMEIPRPYLALHGKVLSLMQSAMPGFKTTHGPVRPRQIKII